MNMFRRIKNALARHGLTGTIVRSYIIIIDYWFDIKYKINTCSFVPLDKLLIRSNNKNRGTMYQPSRVVTLRKLFSKIKTMIPPDSVFLDFGCGKGRSLLVASEFTFREVRGVEFAHELCNIARKNCIAYKRAVGITTEFFRIIESDVVDYRITDENVFFFFNSFDEVVMKRVLHNITESLENNPRRVLIIYSLPRFGNVIEQHENFMKVLDLDLWGLNFRVYSNTEGLLRLNNAVI